MRLKFSALSTELGIAAPLKVENEAVLIATRYVMERILMDLGFDSHEIGKVKDYMESAERGRCRSDIRFRVVWNEATRPGIPATPASAHEDLSFMLENDSIGG